MEKNRKKEKPILIVLHWQKDAANVTNALIPQRGGLKKITLRKNI